MGKGFNTFITLTASLVSSSNRKKKIKRINRENIINKGITYVGQTSVNKVIEDYENLGNVILSGGDSFARNALIIQNIIQARNNGEPVIVIHENHRQLETEIGINFKNSNYLRFIDDKNNYYDPLFGKSEQEISEIISRAILYENDGKIEVDDFVECILSICRKKGTAAYLNFLKKCPFKQLTTVVTNMQTAGLIDISEATRLIEDLNNASAGRCFVEHFFKELNCENVISPSQDKLGRSTSVMDCIKNNGILCINVNSFENKSTLDIIASELELGVMKYRKKVRLILLADNFSDNKSINKITKTLTHYVTWTISSQDVSVTVGEHKELTEWISMAHKVTIFKNSSKCAEKIAKELGDYEKTEITRAKAGNTSFGRFGLHFGANDNISTSQKRENKVNGNDITDLNHREFYLLNNYNATIIKGVLS